MAEWVKRKRCPLCGGRIIVSELMQYSCDFAVSLKNGKLSKRYKKTGGGSMEVMIASCENAPDKCNAQWDEDDFVIDEDCFYERKYID